MRIYVHEWKTRCCIIVLAEDEDAARTMIWKKMKELNVSGVAINITDEIELDQPCVIYSDPPF